MTFAHPADAVIVRPEDVEVLAGGQVRMDLLADASATGGDLSSLRVRLGAGADGARPHRHDRSSEMFYVLSGTVQVLAGEQVVTGHAGELVVVPPGLPHAFAAPVEDDTELLIVITPGVERFEYFRHLGRIARGEATRESLLAEQDRYDTWFLESAAWQAVRG